MAMANLNYFEFFFNAMKQLSIVPSFPSNKVIIFVLDVVKYIKQP